jgi:hypothetical protein
MTQRKRFALYGTNEEMPEAEDLIELTNGRWARFYRMSNEDHKALIWWKAESERLNRALADYLSRTAGDMQENETICEPWKEDQLGHVLRISLTEVFGDLCDEEYESLRDLALKARASADE